MDILTIRQGEGAVTARTAYDIDGALKRHGYREEDVVSVFPSPANAAELSVVVRTGGRRSGLKFRVVGGTYADTSFRRIADGHDMESYGPFDSYEKALEFWRAKSMALIDVARARYTIEPFPEDPAETEPSGKAPAHG